MANTWYVDYDNGNDGTGDGSEGLPWKTLDFATADAQSADLDTIELLYGTNGNHAVEFNISAATTGTKNLTIHGEADAAAQVKIGPSVDYPVLGANDDQAGIITFDNIDIDVSGSASFYNIYNLGKKSITTTNCTFTNDSANRDMVRLASGTNTVDRVMTISDCDMQSLGQGVVNMADGTLSITDTVVAVPNPRTLLITSGTCKDITLDGLTGVAGSVATVARFLGLAGIMEDLEIMNCKIGLTNTVTIPVDNNLTALGNVKITGNTFDTIVGGLVITNSNYTGQVYVDGNTISPSASTAGNNGLQVGLEYSAVSQWVNTGDPYVAGADWKNEGRIYKCHQGYDPDLVVAADTAPGSGTDWKQYWELLKKRRSIVQNNTVIMANDDGGHAMLIGFGADNSVIKANSTTGGSFGGVFKAEGLVIVGNKFEGPKPLSIFSMPSCYVAGNTIISTLNIAVILGDQEPENFTSDNYIVNNIIEQQAAAVCITDDGNPSDGGDYINYNDYYRSDGGDIATLGGNERANLTAVKAQWAIQSAVYGDINDQNSLEEDPQLDSDYKPQNPNVKTGGTPDFNGDDTSMGAIVPGKPSGNRYSGGGRYGR